MTVVTQARSAKARKGQFHEDLSEREMEVLQCIAEGLSKHEDSLRGCISRKKP